MRSQAIGVIFIACLLSCELVTAGQGGELSCASCGYKQSLTIGGTKRSPRLTIYCPQCKTFSQKTFANWGEANKTQEFACPKCSNEKAFAYRGQSRIPCPKCGRTTTKFKTRMHFD